MESYDVIVVGGGISGFALAAQAARSGRSVLVVERSSRLGGCLASHRAPGGFWFELGAHTCYNSYTGLVSLLDGVGLRGEVIARAKTHLRFLAGDRLVQGSNLAALLRALSLRECARSLPRAFGQKKDGQTVYAYYARWVGRRNYGAVLGPMLSAVVSQNVDAFPAGMLFKRREGRRKDYPRSFTFRNGIQSVIEGLARQPGIEVKTGQEVTSIQREGTSFSLVGSSGARWSSRVVAVATPPATTARLLRELAPELAMRVARVGEASVESLGFAVRAEKLRLPPSTFLIPREDAFYSVVTRDSVPDPAWRGFTFHFKPGKSREAKCARAAYLLGLKVNDMEELDERTAVLPAPILGHEGVVREVDRLLAGKPLCVVGNWFGGLSIEDCVDRATREWARIAAMG